MKIELSGALIHALTLVFVALKLTGTIDWSWWWVVSPSLISFGFAIVLLAILGLVSLGAGVGSSHDTA